MATTTSCISAIQTIEAIKLLQNRKLEEYKNTFLNLAVPYTMQSEPGECETVTINDQKISFWTRWIVDLNKINPSLKGFIDHIESTHNIEVTGIK